jgi:hypothetical protein
MDTTLPDVGVDTPAETTGPSDLTGGSPEWLPLAALGGLVGFAFGGWWLWRGWRQKKAAEPLRPVKAEEPAKPPVPATRSAAKAAAATGQQPQSANSVETKGHPDPTPSIVATKAPIGRRADISLTFETLNAQSTLINFRLRYAITLHNAGDATATPVQVRVGLFAGHQAHPQGIAQWYEQPIEDGHHRIDMIAAGETVRFEGELAAPLEALNPLVVDGRAMAIPLIAVDTRYHHGTGEAPLDGQTARAFVVGRDSGIAGAKLAPFRLDQGPMSFHPLGQRDTGISKTE